MANYGTDRVVLQDTTGALLSTSGDPIISTVSDSEEAIVFGAVSTREIQTSIANGAFDSQPSQPDADIDESSNPIAFWSTNDGSGGVITARSVVEATNPSGYTIGITVPDATASGLYWELSTYFPITGNSAEVLAVDPIVYLATGFPGSTPNIDVVLTLEFADTNFTAVGSATMGTATYADLSLITISPAEKSVSTATVIAPSDAAYGKITIKVITTGIVDGAGDDLTVYVREAMVRRGFSYIPISDNVASLQPAASISHSGGDLSIVSGSRSLDGLGNVRLVARNDTLGGTSSTINLSIEQNPTAPVSPDPSATFTMSGMGLSPTIVLSSTESAGDVNLYRNTADEWKTDDSFTIASNLTVGGSATITGNLSAGGISFTNLDVSGTANIVGTATFGTTVVVAGPLIVGGTTILGVPPGVVEAFLGGTSSVPAGWVLANGASLSTATYPALFAVLAYRFGGSGANFSVPNLNNGHILVGSTSSPGTAFMTGSDDAWLNASWNHTHSTDPAAFSSTTATLNTVVAGSGVNSATSTAHTHSINVPATTSSSAGPSDIRRIRVNYIIKT
jgi:microcystin-dependent protein